MSPVAVAGVRTRSFLVGWACASFWFGASYAWIGPYMHQDNTTIPGAMLFQGSFLLVAVVLWRVVIAIREMNR